MTAENRLLAQREIIWAAIHEWTGTASEAQYDAASAAIDDALAVLIRLTREDERRVLAQELNA